MSVILSGLCPSHIYIYIFARNYLFFQNQFPENIAAHCTLVREVGVVEPALEFCAKFHHFGETVL